jgi:hypothetical protein
MDDAMVESLKRHWEEGWNGEDVDVIMEPFARDVVFSSPFISRLTGDPAKTTIDGYDALREYVTGALRRTPGIRYTLQDTYAGTDTIVLLYSCLLPDGTTKLGADSMRVDDDGKVVDWRCHYSADSMG